MSDVLRCDLCTNLSEKPAYNWYTVELNNELFMNISAQTRDIGPWHLCCIQCLLSWTQEKVDERLGRVHG